MKEKMWEDMFTPEGVPTTSPLDRGRAGYLERRDDTQKKRKKKRKNKNCESAGC